MRLLTVVAILLLALVLRSPILGVVAVLLLAVLLLSRLWVRRMERYLRVRHQAPQTLAFNEEANLSVEVENSSLLPIPWLEVRESVPLALRTFTAPRQVVTL